MAGRRGAKTYPSRAPRDGRGIRIDDATGFVRDAGDFVRDRRQGLTSADTADTTPGFGTFHPQDVRRTPPADDPKPIYQPRSEGNPQALSPADMGYTDADVRKSIEMGVPLMSLTPSKGTPV